MVIPASWSLTIPHEEAFWSIGEKGLSSKLCGVSNKLAAWNTCICRMRKYLSAVICSSGF